MQKLSLQLIVTSDITTDHPFYLLPLYHQPKPEVISAALIAQHSVVDCQPISQSSNQVLRYTDKPKPAKKQRVPALDLLDSLV